MTNDSAGLDVVIVAYGPADALARALARLQGSYPAVVVDNSSSPATAAVARQAGALYIDPGANVGFATAVNIALGHLAGSARDVLLLNPDARIDPSELDELHEQLYKDPWLACVAPSQHGPGSTEPRTVRWPWHTPWGAWAEAVGLSRLRLRSSRYFVGGAVLLLRKAALAEVGNFDERFFLYSEDEDWEHRAQERGWRVRYCPEVAAEHAAGGTETDAVRLQLRLHSAIERYIRKWYGTTGWWVYRAGSVFGLGLRLIVRRGPRARNAARLMRLYVTGPDRAAQRAGAIPGPGA